MRDWQFQDAGYQLVQSRAGGWDGAISDAPKNGASSLITWPLALQLCKMGGKLSSFDYLGDHPRSSTRKMLSGDLTLAEVEHHFID